MDVGFVDFVLRAKGRVCQMADNRTSVQNISEKLLTDILAVLSQLRQNDPIKRMLEQI